jgi:beta-aspartyl-peptidase (threonine type)
MHKRIILVFSGYAALLIALIALGLLSDGRKALAGARQVAEREIQAVLDAQVTAWNKGDLEGFMSGYWNSPELSFFSAGQATKGWQPTLDGYRKRYQSAGREMGKLSFTDLQIERAGEEMAWVRGRWKLVTSKETPGGLFTLIFKKLPEGWRIVHDHTSAGAPPSTQPSKSDKR